MVDRNRSRHPKGDGDGGKFAPEAGSESTVELASQSEVEPVKNEAGYQPDGSKAFEERSRKSREKADELKEKEIEALTSAAAFEAEFATRATELDPWVKREPDVEEPHPAPAPVTAPIKLGGAVEYAEGSWLYPPAILDVEKAAAYWSDTILHDSALQNVENADRRSRDFEQYEKRYTHVAGSLPLREKRYKKNHPEEYAAWQVEFKTLRAERDRVLSCFGLIPTSEIRDVVRVGAFWIQTRGYSEENDAKVFATEFVTSSGVVLKTLDVVQKYRLWEIELAFFNRVRVGRTD